METVSTATSSATHLVRDVLDVTLEAMHSGHEAFKEKPSHATTTTTVPEVGKDNMSAFDERISI